MELYTKYPNFRRIIVDIQKIESQNKFELKIYFTLFAPMTIKIRKFDMRIPAQNNNTNYCDLNQLGNRYMSWDDNRRESKSVEEISESHVFMVHLKPIDVRKV